MSPLQIAIDGPVGAGKSDISARLAKKLNMIYVNTGAMYRACAYLCFINKINYKDEERVLSLVQKHIIDLKEPLPKSKKVFRLLIDGKDVTDKIFNPEMDKGSSDVSTLSKIRVYMVNLQQRIALGKSVVMEGRDIGYKVLPNAQMKIFLTASIEERAKRRFKLAKIKKINKTYQENLEDTKSRDYQDTTRKTDPLKKSEDAWEFDTTKLTQNQVVNQIINELIKRKLIN